MERFLRDPDLEARAVGAYLGLAVGDALGATVEFMTPREIRHTYGVHDRIRGGGWLRLRKGEVTDDTTMALTLGRAILAAGHVDAVAVADAFDAWLRAKPVDVGHTVRRGILHFRRTGRPEVPVNEHDAGNGACMRVLPVALATLGAPPHEVAAACRSQGHVTHNNPQSDAACYCVVRMVQIAVSGGGVNEWLRGPVRHLLRADPVFAFRGRLESNPSGYVVHTLRAVFQALFDSDSFRDCLIDVVNRGGDADTTGAIAGGIAAALYGVDGIPRRWLSALNPAVAGECVGQARALLSLSPALQGRNTPPAPDMASVGDRAVVV